MSAHTPGPWAADLGVQEPSIRDRGGNKIADVWAPLRRKPPEELWAESTANAHLIAASPETTAALEWVTNLLNGVGKAGGEPGPGEFEDATNAAQAALRAARGEVTSE